MTQATQRATAADKIERGGAVYTAPRKRNWLEILMFRPKLTAYKSTGEKDE